ncbi:MAG: Mur ligase family protein [Methylobacter sp.]|nr:Mur ligase family protein [Candidatus Methylobacter titanis]
MVIIDDPIILSSDELAAVTGGVWTNPRLVPVILRVAMNPLTACPGDLLITTNREQWKLKRLETETPDALNTLLQKGGVAAVVRRTSSLDCSVNLLRVDDTYQALLAIVAAVRDKASARRVLVTGTDGKTGFKMQLHHLASGQVSVNARLDSNNMDRGICTTLANTKRHHALSIVEVAVSRKRLGISRSQWVRPDLCVITEIGYEHLATHGSMDKLIAAKASVVSGLVDGGCCLIKSDPRYFEQLRQAILSYRNVPILSFGEGVKDLGRLVGAEFDAARYGWQVQAEIDGRSLDYFLPLVERHAPLSSVGALTALHLAGLDAVQAAERFADFKPYATSGRIYPLPARDGVYIVYDQSRHISLFGLDDFFYTAARLAPKPGGRKLLVLGHVYDEREYGPLVRELLPPTRLRSLIEASGIDMLYTVGEREEFEAFLAGTNIPWQHFSHPQALIEPLHNGLCANDLLLVKGDQNEKMFVLTEGLRERAKQSPNKTITVRDRDNGGKTRRGDGI